MNSEVENIAKKALSFSLSDRAYLAEILLASMDLEDEVFVSKEWVNELQRRCEEIDTGKVELLDGEESLMKLRQKYETI